jgi:hypothetical protein
MVLYKRAVLIYILTISVGVTKQENGDYNIEKGWGGINEGKNDR